MVGPGELAVQLADFASVLDCGWQGLPHVLSKAVEGQRGLVGADVEVLGNALGSTLHLRKNGRGRYMNELVTNYDVDGLFPTKCYKYFQGVWNLHPKADFWVIGLLVA